MNADMDTLSSASVDSLLTKIRNLASCFIVEFNNYEVLDWLEALKKRGTLGSLRKPWGENWTSLTRFPATTSGQQRSWKNLRNSGKSGKKQQTSTLAMLLSNARRESAQHSHVHCYNYRKFKHICPTIKTRLIHKGGLRSLWNPLKPGFQRVWNALELLLKPFGTL